MSQVSFRVCVSIAELPLQSIIQSHLKLLHRYVFTSSLFLLHPSYLFINYPSLSMRVVLSLREWSSCNCFSLEELEAAQRNRIETTFAFKMSWDGEEGGSTALLPYTEQHHSLSLSLFPTFPPSFSHLLSPSLHLICSHHPHLLPFAAWLPLHCLSREFQGRRELAHQSRVLYI